MVTALCCGCRHFRSKSRQKSEVAVGLDNPRRPLPAELFQSENEAKVTNKILLQRKVGEYVLIEPGLRKKREEIQRGNYYFFT